MSLFDLFWHIAGWLAIGIVLVGILVSWWIGKMWDS